MKKILVAASLLLFVIMNYGCHSGADPKIITEKFFIALNQKNFEEAKKYATKDSQEFIGMISSFAQNAKDSIIQKPEKFKVSHVQITGDKATAEVQPESRKTPMTVNLLKEDGEWKVAFDKNAVMKMAMDEAKKDSINLHDDIQKGMDSLRKEIR